MIIHENRRTKRINQLESGLVFLQIKHTFGNLNHSVYKVGEFDEFGLSFFVPADDGYFLPGTQLQYRLIKENGYKAESYGIVRYYYRRDSETGESFYKAKICHFQ